MSLMTVTCVFRIDLYSMLCYIDSLNASFSTVVCCRRRHLGEKKNSTNFEAMRSQILFLCDFIPLLGSRKYVYAFPFSFYYYISIVATFSTHVAFSFSTKERLVTSLGLARCSHDNYVYFCTVHCTLPLTKSCFDLTFTDQLSL